MAEWDEKTSITMGDESISCWKPYKSHLRSALEIEKVAPEEEPLSHTGAGKGELDAASIRGNELRIESTHVGGQHEYVVTAEE